MTEWHSTKPGALVRNPAFTLGDGKRNLKTITNVYSSTIW